MRRFFFPAIPIFFFLVKAFRSYHSAITKHSHLKPGRMPALLMSFFKKIIEWHFGSVKGCK
ncbi:MAG: hypothetical protein D6714_05995, partial [Bacteroidetes bacterium]